jgi:hypothetical protein
MDHTIYLKMCPPSVTIQRILGPNVWVLGNLCGILNIYFNIIKSFLAHRRLKFRPELGTYLRSAPV